jgi:hypothetical protein
LREKLIVSGTKKAYASEFKTSAEILVHELNMEAMMKRLSAGLCLLALLSAISLLAPVQTAANDKKPFSYDVSKEVTLNGTVSSVLERPAGALSKSSGMIMGSHLMLATSSGPVDASMGKFALTGKGAIHVGAGQQIEVTGVMKTIKDKEVFLVRSVKVGDEVYTIRNERGVPVSPQGRERASRKTAGEGL